MESEPGQRTTFTVCLRKGKAHFEDSDLMETSVSHQAYEASRLDDSETKEILSKTYPYTILITEDDDEVRCFLERELSLHFKIRTAANGKDALRVLEEEETSLVVSDVMMPEMDGVETTQRIRDMGRKDPYFAVVPIIALTANAMKGVREEFLQSGFNDYISKPVELDKLDDVLRAWVPEDKQRPPPSPWRPGGRAHPRGPAGPAGHRRGPGHVLLRHRPGLSENPLPLPGADPRPPPAHPQPGTRAVGRLRHRGPQPEKRRPVDWRHGPGRPG